MQPQAPRPFTRPQDYYQLRDFGRKFEATIEFFKHHGGNLYRVLLLSLIPFVIGMIIMGLSVFPFMNELKPGSTTLPADATMGMIATGFGAGGLFLMVSFLLMTVLLFGFIKCRMEKEDPNAPITPAEVWAASRGYILPMIGYGIVVSLLMGVGFVLLFIPGIYLAYAFALLPCVIIFENAGLSEAISRPLSLIQGKWWSTFGLILVGSMAIGLVALTVAGIVGLIVALLSPGPLSLDSPGFTAGTIARLIINYAAYPVIFVLIAFQYFNLVERRDGVSLQWKIDQLGQEPKAHQADTQDDTLFRPSYGDQTY
ncbi:hypothetical protein [Hymenobacter sp. CRA2]|uniref:hypothetical protein n=1 Tax=Hymenobacter sp. CRA2 TaxID=1955620 RepID=UPI00098F9DCA|nr:hypothetical protein [Hymenobacter sp. CRA2]OON69745.1 hypothetical protein B0919_07405 [Hymenobacter sp. CRA2]